MNRLRISPVVLFLVVAASISLASDRAWAQVCFQTPPDPSCCPLATAAFTSNSNLAWAAPSPFCPQPSVFDVIKGDIALLHSTQDVSLATTSCLANDLPNQLSATDTFVPAVGSGYWYLVRVVDPIQPLGGPASTTWNSLLAATVQNPDDDSLNLDPPSACFP